MNKGSQVELLYQEKIGDAPQWLTASLLLLECRKSISPFNFQHEKSFTPHCKGKGHSSIRESFALIFKIQLQSQPEPSRRWQSCYINSHTWHFQPFSSLRECIPGHNALRQPKLPSITIWQLGLRCTRASVWVPMQPAHPSGKASLWTIASTAMGRWILQSAIQEAVSHSAGRAKGRNSDVKERQICGTETAVGLSIIILKPGAQKPCA